MGKNSFKKFLPTPEQIKSHNALRFLRSYMRDENLWRFNRNSVPGAIFIGLFCAFLPIPFQMIPAAILAIWFRQNIALSIALVWISNPVTYIPLFSFAYLVGAQLTQEETAQATLDLTTGKLTFDMLWTWIMAHLPTLLLGSIICGTVIGLLGYALADFFWGDHDDEHHHTTTSSETDSEEASGKVSEDDSKKE